MEIIVEVDMLKTGKPARELICDLCNNTIHDSTYSEEKFYAVFWRDKEGLYLEKYICPECKNASYKKKKVISLSDADMDIQDAIKRNFRKKYHGIIVPLETEADWELFIKNPEALRKRGTKF